MMILKRLATGIKNQDWFVVMVEIMIVVLGIFIGMQVTDWNEKRNVQTQVKEYLFALKRDLVADEEMLHIINQQIGNRIKQYKKVKVYTQGKTIDQIQNLYLAFYTNFSMYRPYAWNRTTLNQLKASGTIRQIKNDDIREIIAAYEARSQHLDLDFNNDVLAARAVLQVAYGVINFNYPDPALLRNILDEFFNAKTPSLEQSKLYQSQKADDLPLLSKDMNKVHEMVNHFMDIEVTYEARVDHEIPELITMGKQIVTLIDEEYGLPNAKAN